MILKKGVKVKVCVGKDKGKSGEIIEIDRSNNRAKVKGINIVKKHVKTTKEKKGGIISKENFIDISNLSLFEKEKNLICVPVYEDDSRSLNLIVKEFLKKNQLRISQEIINIIIKRSKGDRKNLNNELSKIKNLAISKKKIEIDDILKLTNLAENYSVFELCDNYLAKNSKKVSNILNENNYTSDDCILILRTIFKYITFFFYLNLKL